MDTSRYRAFIQAIDTGSLSKAAKSLGYTPSGVSQLMQALERELGFPVLERNKQGVKPTENGEKVLPIIRAIIAQEDNLFQYSAEVKGLATGSVTIGSYPSIATHWLPIIIKHFHMRYPGIEIRIMEGIAQEIDEWITTNKVDIAFMSYSDSMQYDWVPLAEDPMIAILPMDHPYANKESFPLKEANGVDFVMPGNGHDVDVVAMFKRFNLEPHIVYQTMENAATLSMVEQSMGISILNSMVTRRLDFNIVKIPVDPPQSIKLGIAIQNLESASPATKRFVNFTIKCFKNASESDLGFDTNF